MIHIEPQPIAVERVQKIRDWLAREERFWLEAHVKGLIADHIAQAGNTATSNALGTLNAQQAPLGSNQQLMTAATYQIFLNLLNHFTDGEDVSFHTTKITP